MRQPVHQSTTKISLEQDQREQQQSFHQQDQPFQHLNTQQSQLIQHPNMRTSSIVAPHMMSSTFLEPLPQYLTAIPVQPIIASGFPATATVLSSIQPPATNLIHSPGIVMTSTQSHIQDQLHRKHDELQQLIVQQQEELRRVSEQLLMARYGLLPSMVNVTSSPVPSDICQTNNRLTNTNYNSTNNQQEPPQHHIIHSSQQILQIDDNQHQQPAQHHLQQQQQQNHHQQSHMHCIADQQINTNSIMSSHQHQQSHADDMISYMQLTSNVSSCMTTPRNQHLGIDENVLMSESRGNLVNSVNQHQHQHQHQHHQHSNELEVMPYQMPEEQAHILFNTSPSSTTPRSQ